jgi:CheY-like chemotaxis protein
VSPLLSATLDVPKVPATTEPATGADLPGELDGIRVLVVDDDTDARELVSFLLESCGGEVRSAASVSDALGILEHFTPHVIVSDIGMPDQDGYFLIRALRTHSAMEKRGIPAIALTAFARSEDRTRALVEGFNTHMAKPVEPRRLVERVVELAIRKPS